MTERLERLLEAQADANRRRDGAYPLHKAILDTLNLNKRTLWRGKAMKRLRERLLIETMRIVADLEVAQASGEAVEDRLHAERQMIKLLLGSRESKKSFLKQIDLFLDVAHPESCDA
jgi:hypothetical protein